ncbi:MAG: dTMP kinase [Euryarchaeota archaeon]|nr:dTMP kinase [Euryarchaeota archaeon]
MLITIEGIDGCGKSTLIEGLKSELTDLNPVFTREPGATWIGEQVRRGIAEEIDPVAEALLFVADHAAHLAEVIRPAEKEDRLIISDRFSDSRYAYQSVTLEGTIQKPLEWLTAVHDTWTQRPDKTFLLVIPVDAALIRLQNNTHREHFERREILEKVQQIYLKLTEQDPERFVIIDALKEEKEILKFVADEIRNSV